jgi:hypothetical protein
MPRKLPIGKDMAERVVSTFVVAAGGVALAEGVGLANITDLDLWKTAGIAGMTAVLTLVKVTFAAAVNKRSGGSLAPGVELKPTDETGPVAEQRRF